MNAQEVAEGIVRNSGNSFHCKVVGYFRSKGWSLSISPYYLDGSTNKPREIDLVAEKAWHYNSLFDYSIRGNITIKLFVECKFLPGVNVFWFDDIDKISALSWLKRNLPGDPPKPMLERHHYLAKEEGVAKLFASENSKQLENEPIYKAINQSLNSVINLRKSRSVIPNGTNGYSNPPLFTLEMPVIVCNTFDKVYRKNIRDEGDLVRVEENFQIEVDYAYVDGSGRNASEYFLIDVVDFSKLDIFLDALEQDESIVAEMVG